MPGHSVTIDLPEWAEKANQELPATIPELEDRMRHVIKFATKNYEENTGGPFAAGLFERGTGKPILIGVNRVMPTNCSSAHAEVVTLSLAQARAGTFDLSTLGDLELVVNWMPCAMCYGACIWSGIKKLVVAGTSREVDQLTGFDEGPRPEDWQGELERRGIEVEVDVLKEESMDSFRAYRALVDENKCTVYNSKANTYSPLSSPAAGNETGDY